jgi:hypothetical protein
MASHIAARMPADSASTVAGNRLHVLIERRVAVSMALFSVWWPWISSSSSDSRTTY